MRELIQTTHFWRDALEHFDERGLDGDKSAMAQAAVAGFHTGFTSAHERSFTQSLNHLIEEGYVAHSGEGELRLTEKGTKYVENTRDKN